MVHVEIDEDKLHLLENSLDSDTSLNDFIIEDIAKKANRKRKRSAVIKACCCAAIASAGIAYTAYAGAIPDISRLVSPKSSRMDVFAPYTKRTSGNEAFFFPASSSGTQSNMDLWNMTYDWSIPDAMDQCLTYEERYLDYQSELSETMRFPQKEAETVFIIRAQPMHLLEMRQDFRIHLRATITEIEQGLGFHAFIVVDRDANEFNSDWIDYVPAEFRNRTIDITHQQIQEQYPGTANDNHDYWTRSQLAIVHFFDSPMARQYKYLWTFERDARLVSGSWPQLMNLIHQSIVQLDGQSASLIALDRLFEANSEEQRTWDCVNAFADRPNVHLVRQHLWGMDRKLGQGMSQYLKQGKVCQDELMVPTAALQLNLSIAIVPVPYYERGDMKCGTFDWCAGAGSVLYTKWRDSPGECLQGPFLLHPYKEEQA